MDERNKLNKNHIEPPAPLPNMRRDEIGVEEWFDERASVENEWNILRSTLKDMFSRESSPGISSVYIYNKNIIFQEEDFIFLFTFFFCFTDCSLTLGNQVVHGLGKWQQKSLMISPFRIGWFIMVIAFEWSAIWAEITRVISKSRASSIWNHTYDFRPKLHDPKFNYHFSRSILRSHNLIA